MFSGVDSLTSYIEFYTWCGKNLVNNFINFLFYPRSCWSSAYPGLVIGFAPSWISLLKIFFAMKLNLKLKKLYYITFLAIDPWKVHIGIMRYENQTSPIYSFWFISLPNNESEIQCTVMQKTTQLYTWSSERRCLLWAKQLTLCNLSLQVLKLQLWDFEVMLWADSFVREISRTSPRIL